MKMIEVIIATNTKDKQNHCFSQEAFKKVGAKNLSIPATENFDLQHIIGRVIEIKKQDNALIAKIELNENYDLNNKVFRIMGKMISNHKENEVNIIDAFEITGVGLIDKINDVY